MNFKKCLGLFFIAIFCIATTAEADPIRFHEWTCYNGSNPEQSTINVDVWFQSANGKDGTHQFQIVPQESNLGVPNAFVQRAFAFKTDGITIYQGAAETVTAQVAIDQTKSRFISVPSQLKMAKIESILNDDQPGLHILPVSEKTVEIHCNWTGPITN